MLKQISISGFKSIKDLGDEGLELRRINVLIGANGAGKSNLVSFFRLLNFMMSDSLQVWVGRSGSASSLLYYGPKVTTQLTARLVFDTMNSVNTYELRLIHAAQDSLIFEDEVLSFRYLDERGRNPFKARLGAGHTETRVRGLAAQPGSSAKVKTARVFRQLLQNARVFHFHDTSDTARVKQSSSIEDNLYLKSDAGNLASRLYLIKQARPKYYDRILNMIRQIAPFFDDFILQPNEYNPGMILLRWKERGTDNIFGPHQLSDGTIRFMALTTLLMQPEGDLPDVIIVDEPELGLHPAAIKVLGSMIATAAERSQIIVTTQSPKLLDEFEPEDIIVAARFKEPDSNRYSTRLERLDAVRLEEWLAEFTLSELWDRNILGGRPRR